MIRRGQCRCGTLLRFPMTSLGYKTRCNTCGSIVRLRTEPVKKSPSSAMRATAAGPPPLPVNSEEPDFSTDVPFEGLVRTPEADMKALSEHESDAPRAMVELDVYRDPSGGGKWLWLVFGVLAALVLLGIGVLAMIWG